MASRIYFRDGPAWAEAVRRATAELIMALRAHTARAEVPQGLFATLASPARETVPTLNRRVEALRRELISLMDQAENFYLLVRAARHKCRAQELRDVREKGAQFLERIEKHLAAETKLLQESLLTTVGVGD